MCYQFSYSTWYKTVECTQFIIWWEKALPLLYEPGLLLSAPLYFPSLFFSLSPSDTISWVFCDRIILSTSRMAKSNMGAGIAMMMAVMVALAMVNEASACGNVASLLSCLPAAKSGAMPPPACCNAMAAFAQGGTAAGEACLCQAVSNPQARNSGANPQYAIQIPQKCNLNYKAGFKCNGVLEFSNFLCLKCYVFDLRPLSSQAQKTCGSSLFDMRSLIQKCPLQVHMFELNVLFISILSYTLRRCWIDLLKHGKIKLWIWFSHWLIGGLARPCAIYNLSPVR